MSCVTCKAFGSIVVVALVVACHIDEKSVYI